MPSLVMGRGAAGEMGQCRFSAGTNRQRAFNMFVTGLFSLPSFSPPSCPGSLSRRSLPAACASEPEDPPVQHGAGPGLGAGAAEPRGGAAGVPGAVQIVSGSSVGSVGRGVEGSGPLRMPPAGLGPALGSTASVRAAGPARPEAPPHPHQRARCRPHGLSVWQATHWFREMEGKHRSSLLLIGDRY